MRPGAVGVRRACGRVGPCDPERPCRAVGGVQKGNRRAAPSGSPQALSGARARVRDTAPQGGDAPSRLRERGGQWPGPERKTPGTTSVRSGRLR